MPGRPGAYPRDALARNLARPAERAGLPGIHFRPRLEVFEDCAFDGHDFGAAEIRAQIDAADASGSNGWIFRNRHNAFGVDIRAVIAG